MVNQAIEAKIVKLANNGQKPQAIFEALKSETRGLKKTDVQYVVYNKMKKKANKAAAKSETKTEATPLRRPRGLSNRDLDTLNAIQTLAGMSDISAEKRLKAIREIL